MDKIVCPNCKEPFNKVDPMLWKCQNCDFSVRLVNNIPVFTDAPNNLVPSEKIERNADQGSLWRRLNWKFLEEVAQILPDNADVLDIGAGRGDFKVIFSNQHYIGLDIYPYPEINLAVDLIEIIPFRENSFDLIVLANVLEHVYEYRALVSNAATLLKPGGRMLITVPFLLKLHQEPVDFHRYTRYSLEKLAFEVGLTVEKLDGYYNSLGLVDEGIGNTWQYSLSNLSGVKKFITKSGLLIIQRISNLLKNYVGNGTIKNSINEPNPNVLGYQVLFIKN